METNIKLQALVMALILAGLLCTMSALWSCEAVLAPSDVGASAASEANGVTVYTQAGSYPTGTSAICLYIYNHTGSDITFGADWKLEVEKGDSWFTVPFKEEIAWPELAQSVADGVTGKLTVDLSYLDYKLTEGKYRVVKDINDSHYAAEFALDNKATEYGEVTYK